MYTRLTWSRILGAVVILGAAAPCAAQEESGESPAIQEARERFDRATQEYVEGHYALALQDFQVVYHLLEQAGRASAPITLFNIARCYERLGQDEDAIRALERFVTDAPAGAPNIDVARTELRDLRARVALQNAQEPTVAAPVRAENGSSQSPERGGISSVGIAVTAIGGASVLASIITGALALSTNADAARDCVDGHCPAALAPTADQAQLFANATDGLLFGGLGVAALGVLLMFVLPAGDQAPAASAGCSATGCGVLLRGQL